LQVEGRFSTRLLVESGWKLSQRKENRLEEKLSHHHYERTNERAETGRVFQPQRASLAADGRSNRTIAAGVDELIDVAGRATIETVLQLSAEQLAGPRTPGQRRQQLLWHGRQAGRVCLRERKLGVSKPRLREKGGGEVAIPAYEAMQENGLSERVLDVLMRGISTRQYCAVLPEMASSCGVSKSNVSREAAKASEEALQELLERRFEDVDLLVIYIDGMMFGEHHVISAVGVDGAGHKHVLGIQSGATENAAGSKTYCSS
jgi:putative transposase